MRSRSGTETKTGRTLLTRAWSSANLAEMEGESRGNEAIPPAVRLHAVVVGPSARAKHGQQRTGSGGRPVADDGEEDDAQAEAAVPLPVGRGRGVGQAVCSDDRTAPESAPPRLTTVGLVRDECVPISCRGPCWVWKAGSAGLIGGRRGVACCDPQRAQTTDVNGNEASEKNLRTVAGLLFTLERHVWPWRREISCRGRSPGRPAVGS